MATMQETLKASSGIDLKELLEGFAGKEQYNNYQTINLLYQ